jgi:hypothetical protein
MYLLYIFPLGLHTIIFFISRVGLLVLWPLVTLYQPEMIGNGDCGEIDGLKIGKGNQSTQRKPAPAPLCPPQIPQIRV